MNNSAERPPYPEHEKNVKEPIPPVSVETPIPEAIQMRTEEDREKIDALRTELVQPPIEIQETQIPAEAVRPSSAVKTPRWLRKVALFAGMLGMGLTATANSKEGPSKETIKATIENVGETEDLTDTLRKDWNDYVDWLEKKGLKGSPALDVNGVGMQLIEEYRMEHPATTLSLASISLIQEEFKQYRLWALQQIKEGKAGFTPGVTEETFMANLSKNDNYAGQLTTMKKFPMAYLQATVGGASRTVPYAKFATRTTSFTKNK